MGSATVIATAFALILLMITAYFLVAAVLTTTEIVAYAQQERLDKQEERMRTSININATSVQAPSILYTEIKNDGSAVISDFKYWDVYTGDNTGSPPVHYQIGDNTGEWNISSITPDMLNPGQLDPQEIMNISIKYPDTRPGWVKIATPNGVFASSYVE
ncbi:hypothetical protein L1994_07100 [Methanomicrobium antiquum]|uniref:Flagellar protein FlaF n=1 Tax=Methanomicrobium antiquum TaxID=487686 RepID=A0AAF0FNP2_9EURY|nr:hypothetical protein [Methanomicrobium antiquum]MDD3977834.1 hypothetical protein [Methanomicrobium sp.]WFN35924.1 hypothetical protein L1994_07100 [Methanomicrobium antiquum]